MVKKSKKYIKKYINDGTNHFSEFDKLQSSNKFINPTSVFLQVTQADDLIGILSNAYENKRARQVIEWENLQFTSMHKTA